MRFVVSLGYRCAIATVFVTLAACAHAVRTTFVMPPHFDHIVIIVQENRSFDDLMNGFPGADTVQFGSTKRGKRIRLEPVGLDANYDIHHSYPDFVKSFDSGRMDGFDLPQAGRRADGDGPKPANQYPQYGFVPHEQIIPYWELASRFGLADRMFQSNFDQSFGAHLFLIGAQAQGVINVPNGHPWGCDSPPGTIVRRLPLDGKNRPPIFPCLTMPTLGEEFNRRHVSWAYYAPSVDHWTVWRRQRHARRRFRHRLELGQLWSIYDAIPAIRYGPSWQDDVISPETTILSDIRHDRLRDVSWVVPDFANSDHSGSHSTTGPVWVASICDAIGRSHYWNDTSIVIVWDDSGGWYDHVRPPRFDYEGSGFRVPMILVSARSKAHYVSHRVREFGSILRFVEDNFHVAPIAYRDAVADDLGDFFDLRKQRSAYQPLLPEVDEGRLLRQKPSYRAPDDD